MRNIALFFDVPIFFLLAGFSLYLTQRLNPIKQIFKLIYFFTFVVVFIDMLLGYFNINDILSAMTLNEANVTRLKVINGSYWFVPMYYATLILSCGLIQTMGKASLLFIPISLIYYILRYNDIYNIHMHFMGATVNGLLFYTSIMLFGYFTYQYKGKLLWIFLSIITLLIFISMVYHRPSNFDLQSSKFPVNLPYVVASLISIFGVMFFKSDKKLPILNFVGNKAIFFYAGQGVGASLLIFIDQDFKMIWYYKLICLFSINLIITFAASFISLFVYNAIPKIFSTYKIKVNSIFFNG